MIAKLKKIIKSFDPRYEIAVFHEFHKPPYGGGNQFLLALKAEFEAQGYRVIANAVSSKTKAVLFNSFNFDFDQLKNIHQQNPKIRMVHRVDGPIGVYRGDSIDEDKHIAEMNHELADATIFQSDYSYQKHVELNLSFKNPQTIHNGVNSKIFNSENRISPPEKNRKIKLIASAWSDNPRKGGPLYKWLDDNLDMTKYEFTFVGRIQQDFKRANIIDAVPSEELAVLLKQHDIYITASQDDPCSNALIEALSCGLPAAYLKSGGHPELVNSGGVGFTGDKDVLAAIDKIAQNYADYQKNIIVEPMSQIARRYLEILVK